MPLPVQAGCTDWRYYCTPAAHCNPVPITAFQMKIIMPQLLGHAGELKPGWTESTGHADSKCKREVSP